MKYIDAEKLKAEIKAWRNKQIGFAWDAVNEVLEIVSSIQQEQPEVDLKKEIDKEWKKCNPIDEGMGVEMAYIHIEAFDIIARHFYLLGLNARK